MSVQSRITARGAEAESLTAPLSSAIQTVGQVHSNLKTNKDRCDKVKLQPKTQTVVTGGMDWLEFYVFCVSIMGYIDMRPQPHDELLSFVADLFPDLSFQGQKQNFGLIMVPRNCFKTVIFSVALPLFLLWKNPNSRGMLSAHRHDASKQYLRAVKWHIENNQKYIDLCGKMKPKFKETKWAEDAIIVLTREVGQVDPSVDTCGVDRSKVGAHPDWIICDDLHSEKNVGSANMRQKVYDHIVDFYPMLQLGGTMLIVGTRWHNADAYGRLIHEDQESVKHGLPPIYNTLIRAAYDVKEGKKVLYFPDRLTEEFLEKAKRRYKLKFSLWFMNQPVADTDKLFPKDHLACPRLDYFFDEDSGLPTIRRRDTAEEIVVSTTMAWDPAGIHPSDSSDYHGFSIVCCDINSRWYIPKAEPFKGKPQAVIARAIQYLQLFQPDVLIIEDVGQSGIWGYMLRQECERQGVHCPGLIFYKPPSLAVKYDRISAALEPKWASFDIVIDPTNRELIDQFDLFPQLDFDDVLDSVHMHIDYAQPPNTQAYLAGGDNIILPNQKRLTPDPREKMGSFAGLASTQWGSDPLDRYDIMK